MDVEMLSKTPCNLSCISQDGLTLSEQEEKDPAVIVSLKEDKNDAQRSMAAEADAVESSGSASKEVEKSSQISGAETPSDALETTASSCTSMSVTAASQSTPIASQPSLVFSFPANNLTDSSAASCPPSSGLETSTSGMAGPGTLLLGTEGLAGVTTLQSLGGAVGGGGIVLLPVQTLSAPAATGQMLQVLPCKAAPVNNPALVGSNIPLQIIGGTFPGQTTTLASPQVLPAFIVQSIEGQLQQQQQQQQLGVISMVAPTSTVANTLTPASPITSASATHILAASQGQVLATLLGASGVGSLLHIGSGTPAPTLNQITSTSVGGQAQVPGSSVAASGPTGPTVTNLVIGNQLFGTLGLGGQTLGVTGTSGLGGQLCSMLPSGCRVLGPGGQVFQVLNPGSVGGTSLCAKPGQQTGLASNTKGISVIGQKLTFGLDSPPPTGQFHKVMQERDAIEKCNGSPKVLKTCKASSPPSSDVKNSMGTIDLQEIREFAKAFKLRRLSLSLTQTQVGHALSVSEGPAYSQSAICRFEKLDLTPKSAQKMMPILERWMCEAEARYQNNPNGLSDFIGSEPSRRRRRRTSFTPNALVALNCYFEGNMHPAGQEMTELAERLGYDREVVRIWFCNKRQALKNTIKQIKGHGASAQTSIAGLPTVTLSNVSMVADPTGTVTGGPSAIEPREMDSSVCAVSVSALVENSENTD